MQRDEYYNTMVGVASPSQMCSNWTKPSRERIAASTRKRAPLSAVNSKTEQMGCHGKHLSEVTPLSINRDEEREAMEAPHRSRRPNIARVRTNDLAPEQRILTAGKLTKLESSGDKELWPKRNDSALNSRYHLHRRPMLLNIKAGCKVKS
jgi:hypothetical protein